MDTKKELVVSAIENGTVIDHIPTEAVYRVIRILGLEDYKDEVLIGNYLQSPKLGRKGIIKIKNKHFTKDEVSKVALVAPFAPQRRRGAPFGGAERQRPLQELRL